MYIAETTTNKTQLCWYLLIQNTLSNIFSLLFYPQISINKIFTCNILLVLEIISTYICMNTKRIKFCLCILEMIS